MPAALDAGRVQAGKACTVLKAKATGLAKKRMSGTSSFDGWRRVIAVAAVAVAVLGAVVWFAVREPAAEDGIPQASTVSSAMSGWSTQDLLTRYRSFNHRAFRGPQDAEAELARLVAELHRREQHDVDAVLDAFSRKEFSKLGPVLATILGRSDDQRIPYVLEKRFLDHGLCEAGIALARYRGTEPVVALLREHLLGPTPPSTSDARGMEYLLHGYVQFLGNASGPESFDLVRDLWNASQQKTRPDWLKSDILAEELARCQTAESRDAALWVLGRMLCSDDSMMLLRAPDYLEEYYPEERTTVLLEACREKPSRYAIEPLAGVDDPRVRDEMIRLFQHSIQEDPDPGYKDARVTNRSCRRRPKFCSRWSWSPSCFCRCSFPGNWTLRSQVRERTP